MQNPEQPDNTDATQDPGQDLPTNDTTFEIGWQNLRIADTRLNARNLGVMYEKLDGSDFFWGTIFLQVGPPIKVMKTAIPMFYEAAGLVPYAWTNPQSLDEGYVALTELVGRTIRAFVGKHRGKDRRLHSEIRQFPAKPTSPEASPKKNDFFDDEIPDLAGGAPEKVEPKIEPVAEALILEHDEKVEPQPAPTPTCDSDTDIDDDAVWYRCGQMMNHMSAFNREAYRLATNHPKKSATKLANAEEGILGEIKTVKTKLGLTK